MNSPRDAFLSQYLAELPAVAYTMSGVAFTTSDNHWQFRDGAQGINCNFDLIPQLAEPLVHGLKVALVWRFKNLAPGTVENNFHQTLRLLRFVAKPRESDKEIDKKKTDRAN